MAVSTGQPFFFYNIYVFTPAAPNLELAASADNEHIYALNSQTNDVTIISTSDGKVIDKIAVGGGCKRVALAPGGHFVYSYTSGQFDLIDTGSNAKAVEYRPSSGKLNSVSVLEDAKRLALLTTNAAIIWDAEKGTQIGTIEGLHQPGLLVQPTPQPVRGF